MTEKQQRTIKKAIRKLRQVSPYRIDHDQLFKELILLFLVDFLKLFFPDLVKLIDLNSIQVERTELFTNMLSGERRAVDLLFRANIQGKPAQLLIHIELQGKWTKDFPKRMFYYYATITMQSDCPVYPIAIFSFKSPKGEVPTEYRIEIPGLKPTVFNYRAVQLNRLNWREFLDKENPVAAALMATMSMDPADRPRVKAQCMKMIAGLRLNDARNEFLSGFVERYLNLTPVEQKAFDGEVSKFQPAEKERVMQMTTSWKEQGRKEGKKEGMKEGKKEGRVEQARETLLRIGTKRWGKPPADVKRTIASLDDSSQLNRMIDAALDAESWTSVLDSTR